MDEWIEFEGRVAPMDWGKSTYTILPIPPDVIDQLALGGGKRVELEINDQSFELALTKAPVLAETFVYTGKRILTATAVTPGELLSLRIRGSDPNKVDLSDDVRAMLIAGEVLAAWEALSPGKRRGLLHPIQTAKRPETRRARIQICAPFWEPIIERLCVATRRNRRLQSCFHGNVLPG